jgi:thiol:disulfide interchange protein
VSHWIIAPIVLPPLVAALMVIAMRGDLLLQAGCLVSRLSSR